jgi:CBS domain-containing protein
MQVCEVMTRAVSIANPEQSIQDAAKLMIDIDAGVLPVGEDDRLVGMITDRDIATRAIAAGKGPQTKVRDVMSVEVMYCFDDEELGDVARHMGEQQVRRLPVLNRDKRLVGIVSLGDLAVSQESGAASRAIEGVSQPGGPHSQSAAF